MEVDEPFTEYVAARWSMLYRLAVLLAGEDAADALTQTALVHAHVTWHEVREAPSADERVKEILAKAALAGPGDPARTTAGDRDDLWSRFSALPARQRAVLVLRCYEYLSDPEIARSLGCRVADVEAETSAALAGLEISATDLSERLVRRAESVDVPLPPVVELLARGHDEQRRQRRRSWRRAAGVVSVVIVGLVAASVVQRVVSEGAHPSRPTAPVAIPPSLSMLPSGRPPRLSYTVRRSLHLSSGREVALAGRPSAIVQTKKWLFVAYASGEIVRVDIATAETRTFVNSSQGEVVTDPAGEHIAWLAAGAGSAVVVIQTVWDGAVLLDDQQAFPAEPSCCDNPFVVNGITQGGNVIASLPAANRAWVWDTPDAGSDSQVREIEGLGNGLVRQVRAGEIEVEYPPSHFAVGVLDGNTFLVRDEVNARAADFGDPRGELVLYADDAGRIHVSERASYAGQRPPRVRLRLPALEDGYSNVRWEDADHVLLDVDDGSLPHGALARCDVSSGACEIAVRFDGPHLVAR